MSDTKAGKGEMPCPACEQMHAAGPHGPCGRLAKTGGEYHNPPDVQCPCGMTIRYTVPIFLTHPNGWEWRIVTPKQKERDAAEHAEGLKVAAVKANWRTPVGGK